MMGRLGRFTILALAACAAARAASGEQGFALGLRANVVGANGKPANDMLGFGVSGSYPLNERWRVVGGLDHSSGFDVERTAALVGLQQDPAVDAIDSEATSNELKGWIERGYRRSDSPWEWYWTAGLGVSFVSVDDVSGPLEGGGTFDIATDASTELLLTAGGGVRRWLGERWALDAALTADRHFADWTLRDRVSGATGSSDDYTVRGLRIGMLRSFEGSR